MTTDPTPPEVGSLWQHKDGERRFVVAYRDNMDCPRCYYARPGRDGVLLDELSDWSAWERDAVRIDKEQA